MTLIRFALRRRFALAACLMLAGVFSVPAAANAQLLAFKAPSGNITCMMSTEDGGFAQCELRFKPRRGGFMVPRMGRVSRYGVAGFDDLAEERFVLRYGTSRRLFSQCLGEVGRQPERERRARLLGPACIHHAYKIAIRADGYEPAACPRRPGTLRRQAGNRML
jgi:hypothetical protein